MKYKKTFWDWLRYGFIERVRIKEINLETVYKSSSMDRLAYFKTDMISNKKILKKYQTNQYKVTHEWNKSNVKFEEDFTEKMKNTTNKVTRSIFKDFKKEKYIEINQGFVETKSIVFLSWDFEFKWERIPFKDWNGK